MGSKFGVLVYPSNVRGLSFWRVMSRVFALRELAALFLKENRHEKEKRFEVSQLILALAYLADIFDALNHLNCQMQRWRQYKLCFPKEVTIMEVSNREQLR